MEEMLGEVNNKSSMKKHDSNMRKWLERFNETINLISYHEIMITPSWLTEQGVNSLQFRDSQSSIIFFKPANITVVGSYSHHLSTHPFLNVDVVIELPPETLCERFIKNFKQNLFIFKFYIN